jgi:hypothetical protein
VTLSRRRTDQGLTPALSCYPYDSTSLEGQMAIRTLNSTQLHQVFKFKLSLPHFDIAREQIKRLRRTIPEHVFFSCLISLLQSVFWRLKITFKMGIRSRLQKENARPRPEANPGPFLSHYSSPEMHTYLRSSY